jgi:hypothetical protein
VYDCVGAVQDRLQLGGGVGLGEVESVPLHTFIRTDRFRWPTYDADQVVVGGVPPEASQNCRSDIA